MTASAARILVATRQMEGQLDHDVNHAVERAGALRVSWSGGAITEEQSGPRLIVARLGAGERRVPPMVARLALRDLPEVPLLLLCDDTLARPLVTLAGGRLTLIGAPSSIESLANRIRVLLASELGDDGTTERHDQVGPRFWVSRLSHGGAGAAARTVAIDDDPEQGLIALLGLGSGAPRGAELQDRARAVRGIDDVLAGSQLRDLLGDEVGMVHLGADGRTWTIYWPRRACPLWLSSSARLPRRQDLAPLVDARGGRLIALAAAPGDLLVASSAPPRSSTEGDAAPALRAALDVGGPEVMDLLERSLRGSPIHGGSLAIEVR